MTHRTLEELAEICGASLEGDPRLRIKGPAALAEAEGDDISFYGHARYQRELEATHAAALVVPRDLAVSRKDVALLRCADANGAFERVIRAFDRLPKRPEPGIHPTAVIGAGAKLGREVSIGAYCVVGDECELGARVVLHPHVVVSPKVTIGDDSEIRSHVTLYDGVSIGARCLVHSGAVIGADGFGFDPRVGPKGIEGWTKVPQAGTVVIEDEVEIGANTAIDRGRFSATRIGRGAKLDNLVHVGHNVQVGANTLLIAQTGVGGSTKIGRGVILAGQSGVNAHIEVADGVRSAPGTKLYESVREAGDYMGFYAMPKGEFLRRLAHFKRLDELVERVRELERQREGRA